jgi:hypothetical protein
LCFRSIELALKSILVHEGATEEEIAKKLRHNIAALLDEVQRKTSLLELGIDPAIEKMLRTNSNSYANKWLEYSSEYYRHPDIDTLINACNDICEKTRGYKKE